MEAVGSELSFYINRVLDTSMSSNGKFTDDTIPKGVIGLMVYYMINSVYVYLWRKKSL